MTGANTISFHDEKENPKQTIYLHVDEMLPVEKLPYSGCPDIQGSTAPDKEAKKICRMMLKKGLLRGFSAPLLYRWKHMERAQVSSDGYLSAVQWMCSHVWNIF